MPYGSGLSGQVGFAAESTWGTPVTVTRFLEHLEEDMNWEPTWLDSAGIKAGQAFKRVSRTKQSRKSVSGGFNLEAPDKGLGLLLKHALGSSATATQIASTTAYRQTHTPGMKTGLGLTVQVGRPQTDGTVRAFTYEGCKVTGWEFSCSDGELAKVRVDVDGQDQSTATALATASYTAGAGIFAFNESSTFTLGGTPATASGRTTITGGTALTTVVRGITIRGETPMATERFGLGNAGVKQQQIENAIPTISGTLEGEFTSRSEIYDLLTGNTTTALQLDFSHGDAGGSNPFRISFVLPAIKIKTAGVNLGGPDIVGQQINFEAYDNEADPVIQIEYVSTDTAL
jgi:hypothetical protein